MQFYFTHRSEAFFANTIEIRQKVAPETKAGIMQKVIKNMPRTKINLKVPSSKKRSVKFASFQFGTTFERDAI